MEIPVLTVFNLSTFTSIFSDILSGNTSSEGGLFSGERGPFDTDERDAIDTGERDSQETVRPFSTCLDVVVSVYLSKFISFLR